MKRKFILSIVAAAAGIMTASAQPAERIVVNAGNIEHITIASDLNVVLLPAENAGGSISFDPAAFEKLDLKLSKNAMQIASRQTGKQKTTVYLQVNSLKTITVEQNSDVKTIGVLDSPKLDLFIGSESTVHLRTNGEVDAHSLNDAELKINYLSDKSLVKR
jgi:hypothetical protein